MTLENLRIALVHDWLVGCAGGEKCLEQMLALFPQADLFSVVDFLPQANRDFILNKTVTTSFIQHLPFAKTKYRHYLPLMPLAIEQFDLSAYDIVISGSHAVAKGVLTSGRQLHLSYIYSPMRYAWDLQHQYLRESGLDKGLKSWPAKWLLHKMRLWDLRTANGVDVFIAISQFIARRIWKVYRRRAKVLYPPVDIDNFTVGRDKEDFYVTVSRLVPYKRIPLIVAAFTAVPDKKLVVIGDGPEFAKAKAIAGKNVQLLGYQPTDVVRDYIQRAKAFVFAAEEDFGIAPLEAQACGTPVIAYGKGGVTETVIPGMTGIFFGEQSVTSLLQAVQEFESSKHPFVPDILRHNAERFSATRFRQEFRQLVEQEWQNFTESSGAYEGY